jgi:serine/threonine protein kinase
MNEESVFYLALERLPGERGAFLSQVCAEDPTLRKRVETLLHIHENPASFLDRPVSDSTPIKAFVEQLTEEMHEDLSGNSQYDEVDGFQMSDSALDFLAPSDDPEFLGCLDHYHIREIVGRGGMGIVLKAFDETLHRVVAIKVMAPELAASPEARQRFVREARAAAAVSHDHVVTIHAVGEWQPPHAPSGTLPYLAMQFISGESLQRRIDLAGTLNVKEIVRIGMQTAAGLAAAHAQGLVHLDVKPANILAENGIERVKITDFGLARAADGIHFTQAGVVAGTPQYMSPEQARGEAVDHRADLFSLGSVLYAMCTGHSPFRADSTMATLRRVSDDTPRPIIDLNPDIPDWFVGIVGKLLAKDPAERFQSAAEVAELLRQYLKHLQEPSTTPRPESLPSSNKKNASQTTGRLNRRRRRFAVAAAIFLLLGSLGWTEATGVTHIADFVGSVLRITTPGGTLIVEVDDPQTRVTIDGDELIIQGAGPREVRLRPGQYKFRATKDGKPLREELVTISRGDKQVVKVSLESTVPSVAGTTSQAERQAFVILGGKDVSEQKFDTLIEAVRGASGGDTVEVRGNGPFLTPPVKIAIGTLAIRAAAGFRPVIGLTPNSAPAHEPLLRCEGPLTLEGLEFQRLNQPAWNTGDSAPSIISTEGSALNIANCRFRSDPPVPNRPYHLYCVQTGATVLRVRNCELYIPTEVSISSWGRTIELDNCLHLGRLALGFDSIKARSGIRISRNTLVTNNSQLIHVHFGVDLDTLADVGTGKKVKLEATGNIFDSVYVLQFGEGDFRTTPIEPDQAEAIFRSALAWTGKENVYTASREFYFTWSQGNRVLPNHGPQDLEGWRKFWNSPETGSVEGRIHYQGGDLIARLIDEPEKLTPDDFRLRADSAGYRAGSDGKDLGADVDLVGPGPAYERWKKLPQYQDWLNETGQLRK